MELELERARVARDQEEADSYEEAQCVQERSFALLPKNGWQPGCPRACAREDFFRTISCFQMRYRKVPVE